MEIAPIPNLPSLSNKPRLSSIAKLKSLCSKVGTVRADGRYVVTYNDEVLCDATADLITQGILYDRPYELPTRKKEHTDVTFADGEIQFN